MERCVVELAAGSQMEVLPHVLGDPLLRRIAHRHLVHQVVDPPHVERDALAEMAEYDLQARELVEQPRADQPQRLGGGLAAEVPGRAVKPAMTFVGPRLRRDG